MKQTIGNHIGQAYVQQYCISVHFKKFFTDNILRQTFKFKSITTAIEHVFMLHSTAEHNKSVLIAF